MCEKMRTFAWRKMILDALHQKPRKSLIYWLLRGYLRIVHDKLYYRHTYVVNSENAPVVGVPTLVAANHQNAINDPLAVQFAFKRRVVSIFTRADVLQIPVVGALLRAFGLLPAFRLEQDGEEALKRNEVVFEEAGMRLLKGYTLAIFPEAVNQDRHWLGDFSLGYLRLAFQAAERDHFRTDIKILPTVLHYSNYFSMQSDVMVKYGVPVSLADYYALYKTKPRTAQRTVNKIVRDRISDMMLNITDEKNYAAIDYLRETYGICHARLIGINPKYLPDRLLSDKQLCAALERYVESHPEEAKLLFDEVLTLRDITKKKRISDWVFDKHVTLMRIIVRVTWMVLLLPLYIVALWPHYFIFVLPEPLVRKFTAKGGHFKMFIGGVRYLISTLITIPLFYTLTVIIDWVAFGWLFALAHFVLLPFLGLFAWYYRLAFIKGRGWLRYHRAMRRDVDFRSWPLRRERLFRRVGEIINNVQTHTDCL